MELFIAKYNYWVAIFLLLMGLHAIIVKKNLLKKIVALSIFQTAIMLFYVSIGVKTNASIPIIPHELAHGHGTIHPEHFTNPLPHVLMLTAIVVGVGIIGVALALLERIYEEYGTIEEDVLITALGEES